KCSTFIINNVINFSDGRMQLVRLFFTVIYNVYWVYGRVKIFPTNCGLQLHGRTFLFLLLYGIPVNLVCLNFYNSSYEDHTASSAHFETLSTRPTITLTDDSQGRGSTTLLGHEDSAQDSTRGFLEEVASVTLWLTKSRLKNVWSCREYYNKSFVGVSKNDALTLPKALTQSETFCHW
ncbi:Hypothetical predicted protein, partial [Paramuricea clavata]